MDTQVKVRGFRIELGEIETVLRQHEQVKDVVVLAREDEPGVKHLVAYYVAEENANRDLNETSRNSGIAITSELRAFAQESLPSYMVVSAFIAIDSLPLTINGKVDREALPKPDLSSQQVGYVAPNNDVEKKLCNYWQSLLNIEQIGIKDNFWALGGQSLLALRLSNMIRQEFRLEISLRKMFEYQNIEDLAGFMIVEIEALKLKESKLLTNLNEVDIEEGVL